MSKILITGAAGFIGFHLSKRLLEEDHIVYGIDNMNDYYDVSLKEARLKKLEDFRNFTFQKLDLIDKVALNNLFETQAFEVVIHLAAQAGVRYSMTNPHAYTESNLIGFMNILEALRNHPVKHFLYASSSSVYGGNKVAPFKTNHNVDHPVSLYAATKKSNELLSHAYAHLYKIPTTGLRFFTVYGPYGRPDMAYFSFSDAITKGKPIKVFNHGKLERDFTYIDDVIQGIVNLLPHIPLAVKGYHEAHHSIGESFAPYKIFNIGNNRPVALMTFIELLEKHLGQKAIKEFVNMQQGDVLTTWADVDDLEKAIQYKPSTTLEEGLKQFTDWYKEYYNV